ncbi:hypothetical protein L1887_01676 [Cichorium endivia]|nr:hypothetical protein L1887_01676 [Cichorium endivia]
MIKLTKSANQDFPIPRFVCNNRTSHQELITFLLATTTATLEKKTIGGSALSKPHHGLHPLLTPSGHPSSSPTPSHPNRRPRLQTSPHPGPESYSTLTFTSPPPPGFDLPLINKNSGFLGVVLEFYTVKLVSWSFASYFFSHSSGNLARLWLAILD